MDHMGRHFPGELRLVKEPEFPWPRALRRLDPYWSSSAGDGVIRIDSGLASIASTICAGTE